ncbi:hypothetical protein NAP1_03715 [Erythrobacter sp. NAP1]|nr:hypothetical protein NAP1_03715 [Erythrobacter sp. NAP1]
MISVHEIGGQATLTLATAPILAVGLMGSGMIGAATATRLWVGVLLALLAGVSLLVVGTVVGMAPAASTLATALAISAASFSFAARGALFARSASNKGWLVALAIVAGEAAIVLTAVAEPGLLPNWLLALLPAQWTSIAIQSSLTGEAMVAARSALIALTGTGAATLVVIWFWPRRWTYSIMFTVWIGFSALVYHSI